MIQRKMLFLIIITYVLLNVLVVSSSTSTPIPSTVTAKELNPNPDLYKFCRNGGPGWGQFPDSQDGNKVLIQCYTRVPQTDSEDVTGINIYYYDLGNEDYVFVGGNGFGDGHSGAHPRWINNEEVIYKTADVNEEGEIVRYNWQVVNISDPTKSRRYRGAGWITDYNDVNGLALIPCGKAVYTFDPVSLDFTVLVDVTDCSLLEEAAHLPAVLEPDHTQWFLGYHAYWSPEGNTATFLLDIPDTDASSDEVFRYWLSCNLDPVTKKATNLNFIFGEHNILLEHAKPFNDYNMFGFCLWPTGIQDYKAGICDLSGDTVTVIGGHGAHGGYSPDRTWIVGESYYSIAPSPQSLWVYRLYDDQPVATLFTEELWPYIYKHSDYTHWWHVDPAFTRDGRHVIANVAYRLDGTVNINDPVEKIHRCKVMLYDLSSLVDEITYYGIKHVSSGKYLQYVDVDQAMSLDLQPLSGNEAQQWEILNSRFDNTSSFITKSSRAQAEGCVQQERFLLNGTVASGIRAVTFNQADFTPTQWEIIDIPGENAQCIVNKVGTHCLDIDADGVPVMTAYNGIGSISDSQKWVVDVYEEPAPSWQTGVWYDKDDIVLYNGKEWICTYAHTSLFVWYPGAPGVYLWNEL